MNVGSRATRLVVVVGVVLVLAGCTGSGTVETSRSAPRMAPSSSPDLGSPDRGVSPRCRAGDTLAIGRSALDASLGRRYLRVDVRNCSTRTLRLVRPVLTAVTAAGRTGTVPVVLTPVAGRPDRNFSLPQGGTASAGLSWRVAPRDGRIGQLRVAVTGDDTPHPLPLDLLELRLTSLADYYPWVSRPDAVFS